MGPKSSSCHRASSTPISSITVGAKKWPLDRSNPSRPVPVILMPPMSTLLLLAPTAATNRSRLAEEMTLPIVECGLRAFRVNQGSKVLIESSLTIAYPTSDLLDFGHQSRHEIIVYTFMNKQPGGGDTCLSRSNECSERHSIHRTGDICIFKDDNWRLPRIEIGNRARLC